MIGQHAARRILPSLVAMGLAFPGVAHAASVSFLAHAATVRVGHAASLQARVSPGVRSCQPSFTSAGVRQRAPATTLHRRMLTLAWRVPGDARGSVWTVRLDCRSNTGSKHAQTRLTVRGRQAGGRLRLVSGRVSLSQSGASLPTPGGSDSGQLDPGSPYQAANPFPVGQCTYYAYQRRPDIANSSDPTPDSEPTGDWSAYRWGDMARAYGYRVDSSPQARDIAVWPRGFKMADPQLGHVAYAESVDANGVTISEMNGPGGPGVVDQRTLDASTVAGLSFIHHR